MLLPHMLVYFELLHMVESADLASEYSSLCVMIQMRRDGIVVHVDILLADGASQLFLSLPDAFEHSIELDQHFLSVFSLQSIID